MATMKRIVQNPAASLDAYFLDFISEKQALEKSPDTIVSYTHTWKKYMSVMGEVLTESSIFKYIKILQDRDLKPHSINHNLRELRTFANWCINRGYIPAFKIQLVKEEEIIQATYTEKEMLTLTQKPNPKDSFATWRTWIMLELIMSTGCRASTSCAVKIQDVDFFANMLYLMKTKNSKPIALPIGKYLASALKQYIAMWRHDASPDDYLFPSVYDTPLTVNGLRLAVNRYNAEKGIVRTGVHKLRHGFAKSWIRSGGSIYKLQKVLGHKDIRMTQHYADIWGKDLEDDFQQFNMLDSIKGKYSREHMIKRK